MHITLLGPYASLTGLAGERQAGKRFENVNFLNRFLASQGAFEINMTRILTTHRYTWKQLTLKLNFPVEYFLQTCLKSVLSSTSSSFVVYVGGNTDGFDGKVIDLLKHWTVKNPNSQKSLFQVFMESYNSSIVIFEPVPSFFSTLTQLWQTYIKSQGFRSDW